MKARLVRHFTEDYSGYPLLKTIFTSNLLQTEEKRILQKENISSVERKNKKRIKAKSPDWRRGYICPSNRTAGQMRNPLGYRVTPRQG